MVFIEIGGRGVVLGALWTFSTIWDNSIFGWLPYILWSW